LKILILASLKRKVAPAITASRSRIIYEIAKGMVEKGHEVTLLGTNDSIIPGVKTIGIIPHSFVELPVSENPYYAETSYLVQLAKKVEIISSDFDIVHNHTYPEFINVMIADKIKVPMLTTIHAEATPELDTVLSLFPTAHFVSISQAHKKGFTKTKIDDVVYNGIDTNLYPYHEQKEDYMLWIGRLSKAKNSDGTFFDPKGVKWAIQLAQQIGKQLLLSGNVEDRDFFEKDVKPHLNDKIQWIGEVGSEQPLSKEKVSELMQKASVFLMPINWSEPFGLVMAEAMSCGTPVIGFNRGSVSELVLHEKTGFLVDPNDGVLGLERAVGKLGMINPSDCRKHIEEHFSVEKMVDGYETIYKQLLNTS
jgi:glycosyltransferase involved in cell wall biosynthesis